MQNFTPPVGVAETIAPGLRRIVAPNPSPMTFRRTNTYIIGTKDLAVIDPGPDDLAHLDAILRAVEPGQRVTHILVTHTHLDHSPLAGPLSERTDATTYGFGGATAGRSAAMARLAEQGLVGGGEGVDTSFIPQVPLRDRSVLHGADWTLQAIHTPGHIGNHLCFAWGTLCFTGDHVMGWASSLVSPPDGDLSDFMVSCTRLRARIWSTFYPGHGAPVSEPNNRLDWLVKHRRARETAILSALRVQPSTPADLTKQIYTDVSPTLRPAAERNVFAHLVDLYQQGMVTAPKLLPDAIYTASRA